MIVLLMAALILVSLSLAIVMVVVRPEMSLIYGAPTEVSHDGYETTQKAYIPEIQANMVLYRHRTTKTEVLTLIPKDTKQDSVFGASFRTIPSSDSGVAHMLEHSVLDVSKGLALVLCSCPRRQRSNSPTLSLSLCNIAGF